MRLVFAGTPAFARSALQALLDAGHDISLVLTQPDRPSGRGLKLRPSEVKALAIERGLQLAQPPTLRDEEALRQLAAAGAQAMVVAAYGLILPQDVLDLFALGCINIHASLLAALARCGAHPARDPGRRCPHRDQHHAHGSRPGYRSCVSSGGHPNR